MLTVDRGGAVLVVEHVSATHAAGEPAVAERCRCAADHGCTVVSAANGGGLWCYIAGLDACADSV
jgi:hypothetical protein